MAATDRDEDEGTQQPDVAPWLARAAAPWLDGTRASLAAMLKNGRLAHALLLQGAPGAGQAEIAIWLAERLVCDHPADAPCRRCAGCRLYRAGNHPDFRWIRVPEDRKEISIAQIRDLSAALSLKSFRGGAKLVLIDPADAMNAHSFNALLKTLEEPAPDTWLLLATGRSERLPRTIASRCAKIRLPLPQPETGLEWLRRQKPGSDWTGLLALAHGAPFLALEYEAAGLADLDREMGEAMQSLAAGRLDLLKHARAWAEHEPAARLFWLESWLTGQLRDAGLASDLVNNNRLPWLRARGGETKIQAGYRLLDALRDARRLVGGSLNTQLLMESLLLSWAPLARPGTGGAQEPVR